MTKPQVVNTALGLGVMAAIWGGIYLYRSQEVSPTLTTTATVQTSPQKYLVKGVRDINGDGLLDMEDAHFLKWCTMESCEDEPIRCPKLVQLSETLFTWQGCSDVTGDDKVTLSDALYTQFVVKGGFMGNRELVPFGEGTKVIRGRVVDENGVGVPGVEITLEPPI